MGDYTMKKLQLLQISASVVAFGAMVALLATVNAHDAMAAQASGTGGAKAKIIAPLEEIGRAHV